MAASSKGQVVVVFVLCRSQVFGLKLVETSTKGELGFLIQMEVR